MGQVNLERATGAPSPALTASGESRSAERARRRAPVRERRSDPR